METGSKKRIDHTPVNQELGEPTVFLLDHFASFAAVV